MRVIGLAGWSGAGKTTLLVRLLPLLRARGLQVSTVKHAHHAFDVDRPGKDSHAHREAGAREVLIASARRWALLHELDSPADEPPLADLLAKLAPVDLVVVEGFKTATHPKIWIHRAANGKPALFPEVPEVRAIASDVLLPDASVPVLPLDDVAAMAEALLAHADPLRDVLAALAAAPRPARLREPRR
ncbi:MAG TPA: molybdopterin-guanine dinucleotide biosynthesis protein B [Salinarimonas sp.]|nr:molybdopterin-guanine dinucleotide biosynthesis protein B [Salinarimonas sp.]